MATEVKIKIQGTSYKEQINSNIQMFKMFKLYFSPIVFCILFVSCILLLVSSAIALEPTAESQFIEDFRIKIVNEKDGAISISKNMGKSFEIIGHVLVPTTKLNDKGYTATLWAGTSEVSGTAVNAIHIKVLNDKTIFSILPNEFYEPKKDYGSYFSSDSSIYTDIKAGQGIFGGGYSPFVGNSVVVNGNKIDRALKASDVIEIIVERPILWPKSIVFENKKGGKIYVYYPNSYQIIGQVVRPVYGIGRFEGSLYLNPGRIRANHPGVIDISTAPNGQLGGFQIIPEKHSHSHEMKYVSSSTQWMVVSGASTEVSTQEGTPPLFKYFLKPQYNPDDIYAKDWKEKFLQRFLVQVIIKGKTKWQPIPIYGIRPGEDLPSDAGMFLRNVEKIRIVFPQVL